MAPKTHRARSALAWRRARPELRFVIETDGLRYHRTPAAQARDAERDQAHTAAGFARLRFSHHQVKYRPDYVKEILRATAAHLTHPKRSG
jgi:very-short-patch-repair endonuclease